MRHRQYLRGPLKSADIAVSARELPLLSDISAADPCPQALAIEFTTEPTTEIALLWDGVIRFIAPVGARLPASPDEVTEENFSRWDLTGALVLHILDPDRARPLLDAVPLMANLPTTVRYEFVSLTRMFLTITLGSITDVVFFHNGRRIVVRNGVPTPAEPKWRQQLTYEFLHGRALIRCPLHDSDPTLDFTELPMPVVADPAFGSTTTLTIAFASRSRYSLFPSWFTTRPYDNIPLLEHSNLVPPSLDFDFEVPTNPRHPSHSLVPPALVFGQAPDEAWLPAHRNHTVRREAQRILSSGPPYRRIELIRPPIPGFREDDEQRRPYVLHQLVVEDTVSHARVASRIPLDGILYLRLDDGSYKIQAIPRWLEPIAAFDGTGALKMSLHKPDARLGDYPAANVIVAFDASTSVTTIIVSAVEYDGELVWERAERTSITQNQLQELRERASKRLNFKFKPDSASSFAPVPERIVRPEPPVNRGYSRMYGMVRDAAARHRLSPEFLLVVLMGEGVYEHLAPINASPPLGPFDPAEELSGTDALGLDWIADNLRDDVGNPVRAANGQTTDQLSHPDIGLQVLIDDGYIDSPRFNRSQLLRVHAFTNEAGTRHFTADVKGWEAAIELVAAELHARLDDMLITAVRARAEFPQESLELLSYARYNADIVQPFWKNTVPLQLKAPGPGQSSRFFTASLGLKRWDKPSWPADNTDPTFTGRERVWWVSLFKVAGSNALKLAGMFR
jgi:hypothetical protein